MLFKDDSWRKMPIAMQAIFTFALIVVAVMLATVWAVPLSGGNPGLLVAYLFIAGLYLIAGLPGFIEAAMTMMLLRKKP